MEQGSTADSRLSTVSLARVAPAPRPRRPRAVVTALDHRISTATPTPLRALGLVVPVATAAPAATRSLAAWSSGQEWAPALSVALASASLAVATEAPRVGGILLIVCTLGDWRCCPSAAVRWKAPSWP